MAVGSGPATDALQAGTKALARAAWGDARAQFARALEIRETPAALLGLGVAARAQLDAVAALDAHERGYRLAREQGDDRLAARLAFELVFDSLTFRGPAEARGWLERGARLLDGLAVGVEHALLAYLRARFALVADHDPDAAQALAAEGARHAREAGFVDGELACIALEGLALVAGGDIQPGMRLLDEAVTGAVAGEIADPQIVGSVCCHLIDACQRVRDFDRAGEWCRRVEEIAERFGDAGLFAHCRTLYGEVLVWQGAWIEAERTLLAVCRDLGAVRLKAAGGLVRLAELRRRQGRLEDARALLEQAGGQELVPVVRAALALDAGDAAAAAAEAERFLRQLGDRDRFQRVPALELVAEAQRTVGDADAAERAVAEARGHRDRDADGAAARRGAPCPRTPRRGHGAGTCSSRARGRGRSLRTQRPSIRGRPGQARAGARAARGRARPGRDPRCSTGAGGPGPARRIHLASATRA
jgi:tetratricopeptide (TPR) repeat protein